MNDTTIAATPVTGLVSLQGLDLDRLDPINVPVQSWQTDAGTQVSFVESRALPMVDLVLRFKAGSALDDQHAGRAALTLYMLEEGVAGLDATQFANRLESLGAVLGKQLRLDHSTLSLRSLSSRERLDPAIALLGQLLGRPDFAPTALVKVKRQLLAYAASRRRLPALRAREEAYRQLFANHPYANALGSTPEGVEALTVEDLKSFHQRGYSASNLHLSVVGDLSRKDAEAIAQRISQALPQNWAAIDPPTPEATPLAPCHVEQPGASVALLLALAVDVPPASPDYLALSVASEVLGSGMESRLMKVVRQHHGLTYGIATRLTPLQATAVFSVQWDIAAQHVQASQALVAEVLHEFAEHGPSLVELQLARQRLGGRLLRRVAQHQGLVELLAEQAHQQLPDGGLGSYLQRLAEITPEQVREAARQLDPRRMVQVSVGPQAGQQALPGTDQ